MVPKAYWGNEPVGLRWLFVIDVSQEAVSRGFLEACCEGIMAALYGSDGNSENENGETSGKTLPEGSKVGIITFDKDVHFYNLSVCAQLSHPPRLEQTT
jgi:protein transport protein SEC24